MSLLSAPTLNYVKYWKHDTSLNNKQTPSMKTNMMPTSHLQGEFQQRELNDSSYGATGARQEKHLSHWDNKKIRSPEYSSNRVRLSTFARFPVIPGVNVHIIAAAGFYYTGQEDIVRCYACDGGLKKWVPGDDPWKEHCKWFPDCPHLEQSNYKSSRREANAEESERKHKETTSTSAKRSSTPDDLTRRMDQMTIGEGKLRQQDVDPDMNSPAALAVLEHGYSQKAVKMVINDLRNKGHDTLTAMSILDVLLSYHDKGIKIPTDDIEKLDPRDEKLESMHNPATKISNKSVTAEAKQKASELGFILEENEKLTSKMMCKRCRGRQRNILVLPCTHFCLCDQCSMEVSLCPECWKPIKERVRTYVL